MRTRILLLLALLLPSFLMASPYYCSHAGHKKGRAHKTTIASLAEDHYDVKYLRFNINLSDTSVYVSGDVSTRAVVVAATMPAYVFELDPTLTIDSAVIDGVSLPSTTVSGFIRSVALPTPLTAGASFTAQIYYHGLPPGGGGGFFNGITHAVSSAGTHMVYTISDPYVAKNWWPCKQSIQDKIDSVDMLVTVPAHVVDGSNGILINIDSVSNPGYWTYNWQTRYPIDYYLISVAIARYAEYRSYWHIPSSPDSMLVQNFFVDTATFNPAYKANFDSIGQMLDFLSSKYGRYPFWKEKYGVCYTTLPGGMEHQTMTTIGVPNTTTIVHELAHQWFGDNVTYQDWHDVWLSEGFATYTEQLYLDHFWSPAAANAHRAVLLSNATNFLCGKIYVDDTTSSTTLFDQRTVYNKAQAVIRMLQYMAPTDSVFFSVLKSYQQTYATSHASTSQFKDIAEAAYGVQLDTFFEQWINNKGFPQFRVSWNQSGSTVWVKLIQTRSCPSFYNTHFYLPVQIQLHSTVADTFIKVYSTADTQVFSFNWAPSVASVAINPEIWSVLRLLPPIQHDTTLSVGGLLPGHNDIRVFPNPASDEWQVYNLASGATLTLFDVTGRVVWEGASSNRGASTIIPGSKLPAGSYTLHYAGATGQVGTLRLVHW